MTRLAQCTCYPATHDSVVELDVREAIPPSFKVRRDRADYPIVIPTRIPVAFTVMLLAATSAFAGPADPPPNGACTCAAAPAQLLEQVDHIFIGDLVEVKGAGEDVGTAVVRVRENLKGDLKGVVEVRDALTTQCSWSVFEMAAPGRYVIFANLDEGELVTPAFCPQTQPLSGWQDRLAPFRAYARAHRPGAAGGAAATAASSTPRPSGPKAGS